MSFLSEQPFALKPKLRKYVPLFPALAVKIKDLLVKPTSGYVEQDLLLLLRLDTAGEHLPGTGAGVVQPLQIKFKTVAWQERKASVFRQLAPNVTTLLERHVQSGVAPETVALGLVPHTEQALSC